MRLVDEIDIALDECSPHHYKVVLENTILEVAPVLISGKTKRGFESLGA